MAVPELLLALIPIIDMFITNRIKDYVQVKEVNKKLPNRTDDVAYEEVNESLPKSKRKGSIKKVSNKSG